MRAPDYVENFGIDAYLHDELDPSIDVLRADGYESRRSPIRSARAPASSIMRSASACP